MFKNKIFYFHPAKLSKTRLNLFETQVIKNDGIVVKTNDVATHVIVEETCDKSVLPISLWTKDPYVVGSMWLSQCLKKKSLIDLDQFVVDKPCQKRRSHSPETPCRSTEVMKINPLFEASGTHLKVSSNFSYRYVGGQKRMHFVTSEKCAALGPITYLEL